MGSTVSLEKCNSKDSQCVRECCHLEGETPVEIRIAHQPPRPAQQTLLYSAAEGHASTVGYKVGGEIGAPCGERHHTTSYTTTSLPIARSPPWPTPPRGGVDELDPQAFLASSEDSFGGPPKAMGSGRMPILGGLGAPRAAQEVPQRERPPRFDGSDIIEEHFFPKIVRVPRGSHSATQRKSQAPPRPASAGGTVTSTTSASNVAVPSAAQGASSTAPD